MGNLKKALRDLVGEVAHVHDSLCEVTKLLCEKLDEDSLVEEKHRHPFGYCSKCGKALSMNMIDNGHGGLVRYHCENCLFAYYFPPPWGTCPSCKVALRYDYEAIQDREGARVHCLRCGYRTTVERKWPMTVREITEKYLRDNNYGGLYTDDCACQVNDLMSCGELDADCKPGYVVPCDCGDHDFHIVPDKQEV